MKKRVTKWDYLAPYLKEVRKTMAWSQSQLGVKLGLTKRNISHLENGLTGISTAQVIAIRALIDYEHGVVGNLWPSMDEIFKG